MANNKVQLADGTTLIDLTSDTVTPQTMLAGVKAHAANGEQITGVVNLANAGTATPLGDVLNGAVGSSNNYAREDHQHPLSITLPSAMSNSEAGSSNKSASCDNYYINGTTPHYIHIVLRYSNTYANKIRLSINNQGFYDIYINGQVSSSTNYSLPRGSYIVYFDGSHYMFRTDGKLPGSIAGDAATVNGHTVLTDVPANAVFTDTLPDYTADTLLGSSTPASNGANIALSKSANDYAFIWIVFGSAATLSGATRGDLQVMEAIIKQTTVIMPLSVGTTTGYIRFALVDKQLQIVSSSFSGLYVHRVYGTLKMS